MGWLHIVLGVLTAVITIVAVVLMTRTVMRLVSVIRLGQPDATRNGPFGPRLRTMVVEFLGHTRMAKWATSGSWHWMVMWGFVRLPVLFEAYGEVLDPHFHWPVIGTWSL